MLGRARTSASGLWRPSLVLASCAALGLLYFLAVTPTAPQDPAAVRLRGGEVRLLAGLLADSRRSLENLTEHAGTAVPPGYLVYNPSCRMPDTDPFHPSLLKLVQREDPVVCSSMPLLTSTRVVPSASEPAGQTGARLHVLRLHTDLLPKYRPRFYGNVTCCYQAITRVDPAPGTGYVGHPDVAEVDNKYNLGHCEDLVGESQLDPETEYVIVRCSASRGGRNKKVYTNVHAVVAPKASVRAKLRRNPFRLPGDPRLSVLIVGVDSVSRLNYFRTMPRTADLLKSTGWYELRGFNKIEDNTFPNLMAILSGMTRPQIEQECFQTALTPMDDCPILWRNFSRQGYITAYAEDEPTIGTFNYKKAGFAHAPTDYYLRPFLLAAQEHLSVRRVHRLNACLGPSTAAEHILGFASSLAKILRNHLYFAFFWMNSFSHNSVNSPSSMDDRLFNFWLELMRSGALNQTLVLFLSDHGMRFGKIRETEVGWLEERLPFINAWLPPAFSERYPHLAEGLRANQDRLTTPWDLHATLRDVLLTPWDRGRPSSRGVCLASPKCASLFEAVPWDRGCQDVAVDPHWCTCIEYRPMSTEEHGVRDAASFIVQSIRDRLASRSANFTSAGYLCAGLSLGKVRSVRGRQDTADVDDYIIILETTPGKAVFEATVRHRRSPLPQDGGSFELLGSISRINEFWEHSQCIHNAELKKYCHCVKGKRPR